MSELALIVPVLNQFELFTNMVSTINYPVHPYVIRNWDDNIGVAAGWNKGIRQAIKDGRRYALIANDDILLETKAVSKCYDFLRDSDATIVSPNFCVPDRDGNSMYFDRQLGIIESIHWSCVFVDMYKLVENCGWFDENFYPAYFEDNDMFYRMHLTDQKHYLLTDVGFYHKQSATCVTVVTKDHWDYCQGYYNYKWGGLPGEEKYDNPFNNKDNGVDFWNKPARERRG